MSTTPMPFVDLQAQQRRLGRTVEDAIARVLAHGLFINGPEVRELEERLAAYCSVGNAVACSNGTDAIVLSLRALGVGAGDAVLVPSFTFAATAEAVVLVGATPVFVDCDEMSFNLDPASLEGSIAAAQRDGLRPRAVIPVDLFGLPADYPAISAIAETASLVVVADAAQSVGATWDGKPVGSLAPVTTTSFFPAKPLGCYGDGGAIFTDDDVLAGVLRSMRAHGQGSHKYENVRIGTNARLDTIQAAVLLQKLAIFDEELALRDQVAARYSELLGDSVVVPTLRSGATSAWAQYTVLVDDRDAVASALRNAGIPTAVYYPVPLHKQPAYTCYPAPGGLPVSERLAERVLSLPMHPYLGTPDQDRVVSALRDAVSG